MNTHLSASFIGIGREGRCFFYQFTPNIFNLHPEWGSTQPPFGPTNPIGGFAYGINDTGAGWFDAYGQSPKCIETADKVV
jgi:hypothetical protein